MNPTRPGLVFPPHYRVSYQTPEFAFTAETNAIGIRDHEVDPEAKQRFRILAVGDSYTYGWGVDLGRAWPKVLEGLLTDKGRPTEVLDLGCPGTSVDAYAVIAERAVPVLRPDAIVVAVLQGDDLKQLDLEPTTGKLFKFNGVADGPSSFGGLMTTVLPNVVELAARRPRTVSAREIRAVWQGNTRDMRKHFDHDESQRFDALDDKIKGMMIDGEMNPWDVYFAVKQPDYFQFTLHPERPDVRRAIDSMATNLARIKEAAAACNAKVVTVPVPAAGYACAKGLESRRRVGYRLDDSVLHSDAPDEAIRLACHQAGVRFLSVTQGFRSEAGKRNLYFEYDGHFNPDGHDLFAKLIAEHFSDPGD
jgi:lysophospholipase L1-like esterase